MEKLILSIIILWSVTLQAQDEAMQIPTWFQENMENSIGSWITDNEDYKSDEEPMEAYGMEWQWAIGKKSITGNMYGFVKGKKTAPFWEFRQYWDFDKNEGVVIQYGQDGTVGQGPIKKTSPNNTEMLQVFGHPDGSKTTHGHRSILTSDQHTTSSFDIDDIGEWVMRRSYIWHKHDLLSDLILQQKMTFEPQGKYFKGEGWNFIQKNARESANILIGEDHFSNEIPAFVGAITDEIIFDNFYIEVDPYTTKIIEASIKNLSTEELAAFNKEYSHLFSFYSLKAEYELLSQLVNKEVNLLGADQVIMYDDRLILQDLIKETKNEKAKEIYAHIVKESTQYLNKFMDNPENPMYFMTPGFKEKLRELEALGLSGKEAMIIADMQTSLNIYQSEGHPRRIQLLKHQLMKDYPVWKDSKNLFKYGAMHMARGESFLTVRDIGNMIANLSESNNQSSFHIMIIGESGETGAPFKSFPASPVDIENGHFSNLKPFFDLTKGDKWHVFDLRPIRKAIENGQIDIDDVNLLRTIKGFDALVIVPKMTAAGF